jgi:hypothetical protein
MYMVLLSPRTSVKLTSLQNKITSHTSCQFTPHHYTSHHFTYLHSNPTCIPLLVNYIRNPLSKLFSLHFCKLTECVWNLFSCVLRFFWWCYMKNICLFQRTSLQTSKDRERILCKLKFKRTVTQVVIHKGTKCTVAHRLMHFVHHLAWGK